MSGKAVSRWNKVAPEDIARAIYDIVGTDSEELEFSWRNPGSVWGQICKAQFKLTTPADRYWLYLTYNDNRKNVQGLYNKMCKRPDKKVVRKWHQVNVEGDVETFCFCKKPESTSDTGFIRCEVCFEWYHGVCVRVNTRKVEEQDHWECPSCKGEPGVPRMFLSSTLVNASYYQIGDVSDVNRHTEPTRRSGPQATSTPKRGKSKSGAGTSLAGQAQERNGKRQEMTGVAKSRSFSHVFTYEGPDVGVAESSVRATRSVSGNRSQVQSRGGSQRSPTSMPSMSSNPMGLVGAVGAVRGNRPQMASSSSAEHVSSPTVSSKAPIEGDKGGRFSGPERYEAVPPTEERSAEGIWPASEELLSSVQHDEEKDTPIKNVKTGESVKKGSPRKDGGSGGGTDSASEDSDYEEIGERVFEATLKIPRDKWDEVKPMPQDVAKGKGQNWAMKRLEWSYLIDRYFAQQVCKSCVLGFRMQRCRDPDSDKRSAYVRFQAYCTRRNCGMTYKFWIDQPPPEGRSCRIKVRGEGRMHHTKYNTNKRRLMGVEQTKLMKKLKYVKSAKLFTKNSAGKGVDMEAVKLGNYSSLHNLKAYRNLRYKVNKAGDFSGNIWDDLVLTKSWFKQMPSMKGKTFKGFIHLLSADPFTVLYFSPKQLNLLRKALKKNPELTVHIDCTGRVVSKLPDPLPQTRLYHYAGVISLDGSAEGGMPLPVFEFVTSAHGVANLTHIFQTFLHRYREEYNVTKANFSMPRVEIDMSMGICSSLLIAFEQGSVATYLQNVFRIMTGREKRPIPFVLHVCRRHVLEFVKKNIKKRYAGKTYVQDVLVKWVHHFVNGKDLWSLILRIEEITVLVGTSAYSDEVKEIEEQIANPTRRAQDQELGEMIDLSSLPDGPPLMLQSPLGWYAHDFCRRRGILPHEQGLRRKSTDEDHVSWESAESSGEDDDVQIEAPTKTPTRNPFFNSSFLSYMLTRILPFSVLFSHAALTHNNYLLSHDTNALVESYFKVLKEDWYKNDLPKKVTRFLRDHYIMLAGKENIFEAALSRQPAYRRSAARAIVSGSEEDDSDNRHSARSQSREESSMKKKAQKKKTRDGNSTHQSKFGKLSKAQPHGQGWGKGVRFAKSNQNSKLVELTEDDEFEVTGLTGDIKARTTKPGIVSQTPNLENSSSSDDEIRAVLKGTGMFSGGGQEDNAFRNKNTDKKQAPLGQGGGKQKSSNAKLKGEGKSEQRRKKHNPSSSDEMNSKGGMPERCTEKWHRGGQKGPEVVETVYHGLYRIPYAGVVNLYGRQLRLNNTCSFDCFLFMSYAMFKTLGPVRDFLVNWRAMGSPYMSSLLKCFRLMDDNQPMAAKVECITVLMSNTGAKRGEDGQILPGPMDTGDFEGEEDRVTRHLSEFFVVAIDGSCRVEACTNFERPQRLERPALTFTLELTNPTTLSQALNNVHTVRCDGRIRDEGGEDSGPCREREVQQIYSWPYHGDPVPFIVYTLVAGPVLATETDVPKRQQIMGETYRLFGYTLKIPIRNHFIAIILHGNTLLEYDGLRPEQLHAHQFDPTARVGTIYLVRETK